MIRNGDRMDNACTDRISGELVGSQLPAWFIDLPRGFGDEGRKGKPVVVFVLLEIRKCDEQEAIQQMWIACRFDSFPDLSVHNINDQQSSRPMSMRCNYLIGCLIEHISLVCRLEFFYRIEVLE